LKAKLNTKEMS